MFQSYSNNFDLLVNLKSSLSVEEHKVSQRVQKRPSLQQLFIATLSFNKKDYSSNLPNPSNEYQIIIRNVWQRLINKYWQETIYLSVSNTASDQYINKLKRNNLFSYKGNDYKIFLNEFTNALVNNHLPIALNHLNESQQAISINNVMYIKYIWHKKLNLCFNYLRFMSKPNNTSYKLISRYINKLTYNSLPLFNVVNNKSYIVMAESSAQVLARNTLSSLYNRLSILSINKNIIKTKYIGLFFINPQDALEYETYINNQYRHSSRHNTLRLSLSSLYNYYNLLSSSRSDMEFRLVPDLKEVSNLIYKYRYYKHIVFVKNQKYGKNYFQGQPIYLIDNIYAKHKYTHKTKYMNCSYIHADTSNMVNYKIVFLNYDTAMHAWNVFKNKNQDYFLPKHPIIKIANLEEFLYSNIKVKTVTQPSKTRVKFLFVPSLDSYLAIKNRLSKNIYINLKEHCQIQFLYIKNLMERTMWSLTSRQPIKL